MPFNRLHDWKAGQSITTALMNQFRDVILRTITGGPGILTTWINNQLIISLDPKHNSNLWLNNISPIIVVYADSKAALPTFEDGDLAGKLAFGIVNDDESEDLGVYINYDLAEDWIGFTHWYTEDV
jgi:hypothetical protein